MDLYNGLKLKGKPAEIPDCSRDELPGFFVEMGYKTGVEIGVYKGGFTQKFCQAGLEIYAIDPWLNYSDYNHPKGQQRLDFLFRHTQRTLAPYSNCTIIRKSSMDAVSDFRDESLDFVYIDGNHHFKYVAEDIYEWAKKIKKSGIVAGHDYYYPKYKANLGVWECLANCEVKFVVDAYTSAYQISNWYITVEDKSPSWMWIKK